MPEKSGALGAYFEKIDCSRVVYEGQNNIWRLTVHNTNCSANEYGNPSFFLIIYLNDEMWWNEFNNTNYKAWQCNAGSSITRYYNIPSWETIKPTFYNVKIELYWYDGKEFYLQDVTYFPISVVVRATINDLMIFSYLAVYLIALVFLGFCMLIAGPIKISTRSRAIVNTKTSSFSIKTKRVVLFYVFLILSWQIANVLISKSLPPDSIHYSLQLSIQFMYLVLFFFLVIGKNSNLKEHGYRWPESFYKCAYSSLFLAVAYNFVVFFLPGFFAQYYVFPSPSLIESLLFIFLGFFISLVGETLFRGYLQSELEKKFDFVKALLMTSILFAVYRFSIFPLNPCHLLLELIYFFLLAAFLGTLYNFSGTLLCPVIFYLTTMTLNSLTPIKVIADEYVKIFWGLIAITLVFLLLEFISE
ncbi:MAG: CPBP family intramembrane metalloprotease [Candidatus Freyarchaeota archaeon]|nr:CPBP family intramembrane metalloprotease [Candidatus Jordarchaeia archaeon]